MVSHPKYMHCGEPALVAFTLSKAVILTDFLILGFGRKMYTDYEIVCKVRGAIYESPKAIEPFSYISIFETLTDKYPSLQAPPFVSQAALF